MLGSGGAAGRLIQVWDKGDRREREPGEGRRERICSFFKKQAEPFVSLSLLTHSTF